MKERHSLVSVSVTSLAVVSQPIGCGCHTANCALPVCFCGGTHLASYYRTPLRCAPRSPRDRASERLEWPPPRLPRPSHFKRCFSTTLFYRHRTIPEEGASLLSCCRSRLSNMLLPAPAPRSLSTGTPLFQLMVVCMSLTTRIAADHPLAPASLPSSMPTPDPSAREPRGPLVAARPGPRPGGRGPHPEQDQPPGVREVAVALGGAASEAFKDNWQTQWPTVGEPLALCSRCVAS